jgi:type IV secretory pathway TraG/TraD family ATPase VirD4
LRLIAASLPLALVVVVQSPAQFEANYGVYQAKVLRSQMEYQIIYRPADYDTAEETAKWLGFKSGFAASYNKRGEGDVSEGLSEREVHVMSADELMLLGDEETICYRSGMRKIRARRIDIRRFPLLKQRQAIPPPPLPDHSEENNRALTTVWEQQLPVSFVDPDARYMRN